MNASRAIAALAVIGLVLAGCWLLLKSTKHAEIARLTPNDTNGIGDPEGASPRSDQSRPSTLAAPESDPRQDIEVDGGIQGASTHTAGDVDADRLSPAILERLSRHSEGIEDYHTWDSATREDLSELRKLEAWTLNQMIGSVQSSEERGVAYYEKYIVPTLTSEVSEESRQEVTRVLRDFIDDYLLVAAREVERTNFRSVDADIGYRQALLRLKSRKEYFLGMEEHLALAGPRAEHQLEALLGERKEPYLVHID